MYTFIMISITFDLEQFKFKSLSLCYNLIFILLIDRGYICKCIMILGDRKFT